MTTESEEERAELCADDDRSAWSREPMTTESEEERAELCADDDRTRGAVSR